MHILNNKIINKSVINDKKEDIFIKDILLFSCTNLKQLHLKNNDVKIFTSARHKNDMPTIFKLGQIDDAMNDALTKISETGSKIKKESGNIVISDSLTIIGNNFDAFIIAFLGGKKHLIRCEIKLDELGNFISINIYAEINKLLKANEKFITEDLEVYHTDNVSEAINDFAKKKIKGLKVKRKHVPSVYCTWYYYGQTITYKDCLTNLEEIKKKNLPLDTFQIDDGWEDYIGDWNPNKKFLFDIDKIVNKIQEYKLTPGIWTSPFIFDKKSKFAKEHQEWILKNNKNKPCIFKMNKKKYFILDITIKDTWFYLEKLYKHLTNDFHFKYHKLDFTRAPITAINANYQNKFITIIEAYRNACLSIRKGMGDSFFLMCGGLYDPLIGIVDAQRSGSDVLSMWSANNRGGKTLPFTMKQSLLRYYMNIWWYNDPDSFVIRKNKKKYHGLKVSLGLLNDIEVKTSTINQILGGGLFSMSEPLDKISDDRLNNIFHILPLKPIEIELVDIMNTPRYPNLIRIKHKNTNYLALINYDDNNYLNKEITSLDILGKKNKEIKSYYVNLSPHASTILKLEKGKIIEINDKGHYLS